MLEPENRTTTHVTARVATSLKELEEKVEDRLKTMDSEGYPSRLLARDASLWTDDEDVRKKIGNRLGWIDLESSVRDSLDELTEYVGEAHDRGVRHVVLLGMGGSSLCPFVFKKTLYEGHPNIDLTVLDLTSPRAVAAVDGLFKKPEEALFLVSSKSGTTIETLSFYEHFARKYAPDQFVAITDPGTPLEELAAKKGFHRVFHGHPDVGGRYAALSMFGLVPAALMGVKVRRLLDRAKAMHTASFAGRRSCSERPGFWLGAVMAEAARAGRDKLTFFISPEIESFGVWIEQLVAESTGKEGQGVIPVVGEAIGAPRVYDEDRVFVHIRLPGDAASKEEKKVDSLEAAGHPVIRFYLDDPYDLGAEMLRWELATAVAGSIMRVNPFDEPNVTDAKKRTSDILSTLEHDARPAEEPPRAIDGDLSLHTDDELRSRAENGSFEDWLTAHFSRLQKGDYVALLAYLPDDPNVAGWLAKYQAAVRDATGAATTVGYGPRYLHSTGQLHKGGPNTGLFVMLTTDETEDREIPNAAYGFAALQRSQALGDEQALRDNGRRVVRCHLGGSEMGSGLAELGGRLNAALSRVKRVE